MAKKKPHTRGRRPKAEAELTEVQWEIMNVLWQHAPCSAGTVQEVLAQTRQWAYSTVKTTMDRMAEKGFLEVERVRHVQLFRPTFNEADAKLSEIRRMLKRMFNGGLSPMMQLLFEHGGVSAREADELRDLIARSKKANKAKSP